jgi:hypothetical protein
MINFIFLIILTLFTGCVGEVETSDQRAGSTDPAPTGQLSFMGISRLIPISDTRVEIYFPSAQGGSGLYVYEIYSDHLTSPIILSTDSLGNPDSRGEYRYMLKGLERLRSYKIKIDVKDKLSPAQFIQGETRTVSTFPFEVGRFDGLVSVMNMPGQAGKDSLRIRFVPAEISGSLILQPWDPTTYELTVIDITKLNVTDMDVAGLNINDGLWKFNFNSNSVVNEYVVRGLPSNTEFDLRLRVIHNSSVTDFFDPRRRGEMNNKYIRAKTLSDDLASINFNGTSFNISLPPGDLGLSTLNMTWDKAEGVFDHYRVYFSRPNTSLNLSQLPFLCLPPLLTPSTSNAFCKKIDADEAFSYISGLQAYADYEVVLVLCQTSRCSSGTYLTSGVESLFSEVRSIKTDPNLAQFSGITSLESSGLLQEIDLIKINFSIPDFTQGYFDGLRLKMKRSIDDSTVPEVITIDSAPIYHESYDFLKQGVIRLRGIDRTSLAPYCFTLYPFKESSTPGEIEEFPTGIWRCFVATIELPTNKQFQGFSEVFLSPGGYVNFQWVPPAQGAYSHYEIFIRHTPGEFDFSQAIAETMANNFTNYNRILIPKERGDSYSIMPLTDGNYRFGILTLFYLITPENTTLLRSESNSGIFQCSIVAEAEPAACTKL